jgi:hypothetical protein
MNFCNSDYKEAWCVKMSAREETVKMNAKEKQGQEGKGHKKNGSTAIMRDWGCIQKVP